MNLKTVFVICSGLVLQRVCQVRGNAIKDLFLADDTGENICKGNLDCFAYLNSTITLDFNLVIDSPVSGLVFRVISNDAVAYVMELTNGFTVHACYCIATKEVYLSDKCDSDDIPPDTYHLTYDVYVPGYPGDTWMALLEIKANKGFSAYRTLVQW